MKLLTGWLAAALAVMCWTIAPAAAENRVALVIGNSAYQNIRPLPTPAADADAVSETLKAAGFEVMDLRDVKAAEIGQTMRDFLDKVAAAGDSGVALFYFSGYGAQTQGENFLVPVDARIGRDTDIPAEAFRLNDLLGELAETPAAAKIVILDATRDHGFGRQTGTPVTPGLFTVDVPNKMLVGFSAAPGAIAPDGDAGMSAYSTALVTLMRQPGLDFDQIMKGVRLQLNQATNGQQVPWMDSKLDVDVSLFEPPTGTAAPTELPAAPGLAAIAVPPKGERDLSREFLQSIGADAAYQVAIEEDSLDVYQWFVELYPTHANAGQILDLIEKRREAALYKRARAQATPNAFYNYQKRYPKGRYLTEVQEELQAISAPIEPPADYVPAPEPLPPDYSDEAVGLADLVIQGLTPPPPVFDDAPPPVFIAPPPPWIFGRPRGPRIFSPPPPPPFGWRSTRLTDRRIDRHKVRIDRVNRDNAKINRTSHTNRTTRTTTTNNKTRVMVDRASDMKHNKLRTTRTTKSGVTIPTSKTTRTTTTSPTGHTRRDGITLPPRDHTRSNLTSRTTNTNRTITTMPTTRSTTNLPPVPTSRTHNLTTRSNNLTTRTHQTTRTDRVIGRNNQLTTRSNQLTTRSNRVTTRSNHLTTRSNQQTRTLTRSHPTHTLSRTTHPTRTTSRTTHATQRINRANTTQRVTRSHATQRINRAHTTQRVTRTNPTQRINRANTIQRTNRATTMQRVNRTAQPRNITRQVNRPTVRTAPTRATPKRCPPNRPRC